MALLESLQRYTTARADRREWSLRPQPARSMGATAMSPLPQPITPGQFDAVLFDLDGILTSTARIYSMSRSNWAARGFHGSSGPSTCAPGRLIDRSSGKRPPGTSPGQDATTGFVPREARRGRLD